MSLSIRLFLFSPFYTASVTGIPALMKRQQLSLGACTVQLRAGYRPLTATDGIGKQADHSNGQGINLDRQAGKSLERQTGRQVRRETGRADTGSAERPVKILIGRQTGRQAGICKGRQAGTVKAGRQAGRNCKGRLESVMAGSNCKGGQAGICKGRQAGRNCKGRQTGTVKAGRNL